MAPTFSDADVKALRGDALAMINLGQSILKRLASAGQEPPPPPTNLREAGSTTLTEEGRAWLKTMLFDHKVPIRRISAISGISTDSIAKWRDRWAKELGVS